jgi:hypothetical protein
MTYDLTFPTADEAAEYFTGLSFRRLPVRGAVTLAGNGWTDHGAPLTVFARRHLSNPLAYTFTEMPRRAA